MRALVTALALLAAPALADDSVVKRCSAQHPVGVARAYCLSGWLDQVVAGAGAGAALEAAEGFVKSGVMNDCHVMAHNIGHASWRKTRELRSAFAACTKACIQGCMHGVVEASMMPEGGGLAAPRVLAFCDSLGKGSVERRQCLHGLGHGLMHQRRDDVNAALGACEALGARFERDQCLGGMWMQWAHFPVRDGAAGYRAKAPALCAAVRAELQPRCAHAVGGAAMFATGHDEAASREICATLPAAQRKECLRGVQYEVDILKKEGVHAHHH